MAPFSPLQQSALTAAEGLMERPAYIDQMEQTLTGLLKVTQVLPLMIQT